MIPNLNNNKVTRAQLSDSDTMVTIAIVTK